MPGPTSVYRKGGHIIRRGTEMLEQIQSELASGAEGLIPSHLLHPQSEPKGHVEAPNFAEELNFD